jgi:hypothetical protein
MIRVSVTDEQGVLLDTVELDEPLVDSEFAALDSLGLVVGAR